MKIRGTRCKLLRNPPKHKSGNGEGDEFDGTAIAVSPNVMEYHALGSLIPAGTKVDGKVRPEGAIWVHVYRRTQRGRDTFRYVSSHVFEDTKGVSEGQEGRDQANFDRLIQ